MPAPATIDEFVDLIRKSAVLDDSRVTAYIQKLKESGEISTDLNSLAGLFVRDGLLTYFQAEQFLQGRWKRFNIGKYKVLERLGSGGMGQVFLCEHKLMRRRVAVKVLPTAKATDPSSLERFYREARAVAALDHQNIVRAYDIDQDDNLHFLVMEYVDGSSLQDMIRKGGPMDPTRSAHYIYWAAVGLQHAHDNGLIHRDIKPGNVLVDRQGVVKILDLGLARFFNDDQDLLTKKYDENVLGTADYLAPEQAIDSHSVDGRADIYSLGATWYYMLSGHPPFAEGTVAQKLLWHQTRSPKPISEYRSDLPPGLVQILEKTMSKKAADRYATPIELADALLPYTQTPISPPPDIEMPTLSAALLNGVGGGSSTMVPAARTMVTAAPRTPITGGSDKLRATPDSNRQNKIGAEPKRPTDDDTVRSARPTPVVEVLPDSVPGTPVWEGFNQDTANNAHDESVRTSNAGRSSKKSKTTAPTPAKPKSSTRMGRTPKKFPILPVVGGGVILLAAIVVGVIVAFSGSSSKPTNSTATQGTDQSRQLVLTKKPAGQPLHFASLRDAMAQYKSGDSIAIADDEWEEIGIINKAANVTISGKDGKQVIWKAPPDTKPNKNALLTVLNCDNFKLSGITFRAAELTAYGVHVSGNCSGTVLEDLEITDATTANILFRDCTGTANKPIIVRNSRLYDTGGSEGKSAIWFETQPIDPKPGILIPVNRDIIIRECRLQGPYAMAGVVFEGGMVSVKILNNRIFNAAEGILFKKPRPEVEMQAAVTNNTFHTIRNAGIYMEDLAPMKKPANKITIDYNFFSNMTMVVRADGDPNGVTFVQRLHNFRNKGVAEGTKLIFEAKEVEVTLPADPTKKPFLTYDKNNPLAKIGEGKPVGAVGE